MIGMGTPDTEWHRQTHTHIAFVVTLKQWPVHIVRLQLLPWLLFQKLVQRIRFSIKRSFQPYPLVLLRMMREAIGNQFRPTTFSLVIGSAILGLPTMTETYAHLWDAKIAVSWSNSILPQQWIDLVSAMVWESSSDPVLHCLVACADSQTSCNFGNTVLLLFMYAIASSFEIYQ